MNTEFLSSRFQEMSHKRIQHSVKIKIEEWLIFVDKWLFLYAQLSLTPNMLRTFKQQVALAALSFTFAGTAWSQGNYQQVVSSTSHGNKVYLEINALRLQQSLDSLFLHAGLGQGSGPGGQVDWSQVLDNGNSPGMDVDFDGFNAFGVENLTAGGTVSADSLILNKDASITGRLNVSGVSELGDSLIVHGFVAFHDSLEVVKAVSIGQTLYVTGVTSLGDSLHVAGNVDLDALFNVDGAATFGSTVTVTGVTSLSDSLHVTGNADFDAEVNVDGRLTINDVLRVQRLEVDSSEATGNAAFARGYHAIAYGDHSTAMDSLSEAWGPSSKALGREAVTYARDAVALGYQSQAADSLAWSSTEYGKGYHAIALGAQSSALGTFTYTLGSQSSTTKDVTNAYAIGYHSTVSEYGHFAFALGANSTAKGVNSMAFGYGSTANMYHSMAFGNNATASMPHSMAFGQYSMASADQAITLGRSSTASGPHAFALGEYSTASGYGSRALGYQSTASGPNSFALGYFATASGHNSMAFGQFSTAAYSHAISLGEQAQANQYGAVALGNLSIANGTQSFVHALNSTANSSHEVIFGAHSDHTAFPDSDSLNWIETDPLFIIGNGSSSSNRSNALVIRKDGAAAFSDSMHVAGHLTLASQITASGLATFNDSIVAASALSVAGTLTADSIVATKVINGQISSLSNQTTDGLAEGSTNLYYTDARVNALMADTLNNFNTRITALESGSGSATWSCGDEVSFDGYSYGTVSIGSDCWFSENLRSTHYADGTLIPNRTSVASWSFPTNTNGDGRCLYDTTYANLEPYGYLYNQFAVLSILGLCPDGWHVSSVADWENLKTTVGGGTGGALHIKSTHWDGADTYGFNAIAAGTRTHNTGIFQEKDGRAYFWTPTAGEGSTLYYLESGSENIMTAYEWQFWGGSVRCVKTSELP